MADLLAFMANAGEKKYSIKKESLKEEIKEEDDVKDYLTQQKEQKPKKSFIEDFDDSPMSSPRGSFDDDDDYDDDDDQKGRVDLNAFMQQSEAAVLVDEHEDEEEEGEDESEESEEEGEDEGFETEQTFYDDTDLSPVLDVIGETPSQEQLRRQKEYNEEIVKKKKKALIQEYLHDMKRIKRLRVKNCLLSLKINAKAEEHSATLDYYLQGEREERARKKEEERLKRIQMQKACDRERRKREREERRKEKARLRRLRKHNKKKAKTKDHHVILMNEPTMVCKGPCTERAEDVSLKKLEKEHIYDVTVLQERDTFPEQEEEKQVEKVQDENQCRRYSLKKIPSLKKFPGDKTRYARFSFQRSQFLKDVPPRKATTKNFLNKIIASFHGTLKGKNLKSKSAIKKSVQAGSQSTMETPRSSSVNWTSKKVSHVGLVKGFKSRKKFEMTKEAATFAKAMKQMALDKFVVDHQIMLSTPQTVDLKNLNHFKFEFADPRLTARQVSMKMRDELLKLLHHRRIPSGRKKFPMEVKGVSFNTKNPYGRVQLNFTRLMETDTDLPNVGYRMALTNIAYMLAKEKRMKELHGKNMSNLEMERQKLVTGLENILNEIIEGLRIWASLSGVAWAEKQSAKMDTEKFIEHLKKVYDSFLTDLLVKLYKAISSNDFAIRRLHISEGKGEGAELHEFKDIMRCANKLKVEHRGLQVDIDHYQEHCKDLLKLVRQTDRKLRDVTGSVNLIKDDLGIMTKAMNSMIGGLQTAQHLAKRKKEAELIIRADAGIVASPLLLKDYMEITDRIKDTKIRRTALSHRVHATVREIHKIIPTR